VTIFLASASDKPAIDLGWVTDPVDAEVAVGAFKHCRKAGVVGSEPSQGRARDGTGPWRHQRHAYSQVRPPNGADHLAREPGVLYAESGRPQCHDSKIRAFGVHELRVVDASAFPFSIPGHPHATVYMLPDDIKRAD
jgi:choline dehydrogenase